MTELEEQSKAWSAAETVARMVPPIEFQDHEIVRVGKFMVWRHPDDIGPDDLICMYDGDLRNVLHPDDPRLA